MVAKVHEGTYWKRCRYAFVNTLSFSFTMHTFFSSPNIICSEALYLSTPTFDTAERNCQSKHTDHSIPSQNKLARAVPTPRSTRDDPKLILIPLLLSFSTAAWGGLSSSSMGSSTSTVSSGQSAPTPSSEEPTPSSSPPRSGL